MQLIFLSLRVLSLIHPSAPENQGGAGWTDNICTRLLDKYESENHVYFSITTPQILHRLADHTETLIRESADSNGCV